jgi:hypothetical protein
MTFLEQVRQKRQIEIAELMVSANNYAAGYAEALIMGTPKDQLMDPAEPRKEKGLSAEDVARIEREMESLERDFKAVEGGYIHSGGSNCCQAHPNAFFIRARVLSTTSISPASMR